MWTFYFTRRFSTVFSHNKFVVISFKLTASFFCRRDRLGKSIYLQIKDNCVFGLYTCVVYFIYFICVVHNGILIDFV